MKLKQDGKVIGKVGLQFGNSLRTNAETFVIKTQSVDILISTQSYFRGTRESCKKKRLKTHQEMGMTKLQGQQKLKENENHPNCTISYLHHKCKVLILHFSFFFEILSNVYYYILP